MSLIPSGISSRTALLYCDLCGGVLLPPGRQTPRSFRASAPIDLAPLYRPRNEVLATAQREHWAKSETGTWTCDACGRPIQPAADAEHDRPLRGVKVLVVEDNADSRELLGEALTLDGAHCTLACSGHEAYELFKAGPPYVLVSDIFMPDGDGFELIGRIRASPPEEGGRVPAVAISASCNFEQALMAGYHAFLPKPLDAEALVGTLEQLVRAEADIPSA
jgi:CheY-like chemotaxis protein